MTINMEKIKEIKIKDEFITLGQFIKLVDLVFSGGEVKYFLANNEVLINNELDSRRGRKLYKDDLIKIEGNIYKIC